MTKVLEDAIEVFEAKQVEENFLNQDRFNISPQITPEQRHKMQERIKQKKREVYTPRNTFNNYSGRL